MPEEVTNAPEAPLEGQVEGQAQEQAPVEGQAEEVFFEFGEGDGRQVFKTREELAREMRNSYLRRSDYDRKNQQRESEYKKRMKEIEDRDKELQERAKEYEKFNNFIKNRPDVYKELKSRLARPNPGVVYDQSKEYADSISKELREELDGLKQWKEQQEMERQKQQVFQTLKSKYPDIDPKRIDEMVETLSHGEPLDLYETLYFADRGRRSPIETEQRVAANMERKKSASMVPPGSTGSSQKKGFSSLDDVANKLSGS